MISRDILAAQKNVWSRFCFKTARAEWIYSVLKILLNLCSLRRLRRLAAKKFTQIYLRLPVFSKCLKWVFQVCLRRLWVSVFLEKRPRDGFRGALSLVAVPKWFHNGFLCLYLSKRWQSVSWYNLHKELNGIKDFLVKKQFFLYWIRHRYQSKTCVEHIEQIF